MLRYAVLVVISALLAVSLAPATVANAGDPFSCHAKIGVVHNNTNDPVNYPHTANMALSLTPSGNGYDFTFTGVSPIIPTGGSISPAGVVDLSGAGLYNGLPSTVTGAGQAWFYDQAQTLPQRIRVTNLIRSSQANPFPNIDYNIDCFFQPTGADDDDGDGVPDKTVVELPTVVSTVQAHLNPSMTDLVRRNFDQSTTPVTLNDPTDFELVMDKLGYMEANVLRIPYETEVYFGSSLNSANSDATFNLPQEFSGSSPTQPISGFDHGYFTMYSDGLVGGLEFDAGISGTQSFSLGPNAQSGAWYTESLPVNPNDFTVDLQSGQVTGSGQFYGYFDNLAAAGGAQTAGSGGLGGPLLFDYTVVTVFSPATLLPLAALDNCPTVPNPGQEDADANGIGDACDGFFWADSDCNGMIDPFDGLEATLAAAGIDTGASEDCEGGTSGPTPDSYEWGDWDCSGARDGGDAIVPLRDAADVAQTGLPEDCPAPGQFIPANTP